MDKKIHAISNWDIAIIRLEESELIKLKPLIVLAESMASPPIFVETLVTYN